MEGNPMGTSCKKAQLMTDGFCKYESRLMLYLTSFEIVYFKPHSTNKMKCFYTQKMLTMLTGFQTFSELFSKQMSVVWSPNKSLVADITREFHPRAQTSARVDGP